MPLARRFVPRIASAGIVALAAAAIAIAGCPAVGIIGSWAALEAMKVLTGKAPHGDLVRFDFWNDERQFLKPPRTRCRFCLWTAGSSAWPSSNCSAMP